MEMFHDEGIHTSLLTFSAPAFSGWRVLDVAVGMAYSMMSSYGKKNRSLSAAAGFLRGYNATYPLTELERTHLPLLMACRLACSVTLGAYAYQQNPLNKYLLFHAEPGWKALELLWGYDSSSREKLADAARALFNQACLYSDAREKVVTCYDLVFPDPSVADLLASVRVTSIESNLEPSKKRQKTTGSGSKPTIAYITKERLEFEEAKRLLTATTGTEDENSQLQYSLESLDIASPTVEGDILSVARSRCSDAAKKSGRAVVAEVSGLCFNALNGLPGPFTQTFIDVSGLVGLQKMIAGFEDTSAYAQTVVCFSPGPAYDPVYFDGRANGHIVLPRGRNGFGFDSIFEPSDGLGLTYGEMDPGQKDLISHRSRAFSQLHTYLHKFRSEIASKL
jgi:inosine triphosphate pyrophosphatase